MIVCPSSKRQKAINFGGFARIAPALFVFCVVCLAQFEAWAAEAWFDCAVDDAGISSDGGLLLKLTDRGRPQAFRSKNFSADKSVTREMLAIALAAMTNGLDVRVLVDPDVGARPRIEKIRLLPE